MKRVIWLFLLSNLFVSSYCQQKPEPTIPDTYAGKYLKEWLLVFASGKQDKYENFIFTNYHTKLLADSSDAVVLADRMARKYMDAKSYRIRKIEKSSEFEIITLAQASLTNLWFRITLKADPSSSHKITVLTTQRIPPPPGAQKKLTELQLTESVNKFIDKLESEDAFSGTLLIAKDDKVILTKAVGLANKAHNIPNRVDTKLNIASIGKMFTAIAILQLMERGKMLLTDTVGKFLPGYPNKQITGRVTIHHLLTHTSGMGDIHSPEYICRKGILRQVADYFPLFEKDSLEFEPGAKCQYSNAGFILLGAIIEKVSAENYFDYIRKNIFNPAGMLNTDFYEADIDVPNLATGYTNFKDLGDDYFEFQLGLRRNTSLYLLAKGNPQGGAFSTAEDLLKFTRAFKSNKLLKSETVKLMTTNKTFFRKYDVSDVYYGYGIELETENGKRVLGHGGGDLGISSAVRMYPDSGNYTVIVLSNYDRGGIITIYKIQEMLTEY